MIIYAIIVTYNGQHWVDFCLGSLRKSSVETIPIVIDNCSTDDTLSYIRSQYPEAILFPQDKNLGFGQANNVGLRYALSHNADYVLLLNQDAAIAPTAIERMLAQSDGKSLLSPIHLNGDGKHIDHNFRQNTLLHNHIVIDDLVTRRELAPYYKIGEVCAACWLLPISIIQQIGGFNPLFTQYGEDNNYYQRLCFHHISTLLVPTAHVYHDRKIQGNIKAYRKHILYRQLLLNATNTNLNMQQRARAQFAVLYRCYTYNLIHGEYVIGAYLFNVLRLLAKTKQIIHSRKIEKRTRRTWL